MIQCLLRTYLGLVLLHPPGNVDLHILLYYLSSMLLFIDLDTGAATGYQTDIRKRSEILEQWNCVLRLRCGVPRIGTRLGN